MSMQAWYIRRGDDINGPFPLGQVSRYVLLGRVSLDDEVSQDGEHWRAVREAAELVPEVMRGDPNDPLYPERLAAARRWADERSTSGERREQPTEDLAGERRTGEDRRQPEPQEVARYRQLKNERTRPPVKRERGTWLVFGLALFFLVIGGALYQMQPKQAAATRDCRSPPSHGVDWNNCDLPAARLAGADLSDARMRSTNLLGSDFTGARLSTADLSFAVLTAANLSKSDLTRAQLKGASLRGADLTDAILREADLSYADLAGAKIEGADLTGARLDHTVWIDNRVCEAGSQEKCIPGAALAEDIHVDGEKPFLGR